MISFIRLIDQTILIAEVIDDGEEIITLRNALILEATYTETIEQKYSFKGMYCPFIDSNEVISEIDRINVVSMHYGLDSFIITQYNNYIVQWYKARTSYKDTEYERDVKEELEELMQIMKQRNQSNTVH